VVALELAAGAPDETRVRLEGFDGPIALLLSLIESRRLDVLEVPLGDLAGAYLEALATVRDPMAHTSAFVTIAAQLILIKSRALLPQPPAPPEAVTDDEAAEDPEEALRRRLLEYRAYRDAARRLAEMTAAPLFRRVAAAAVASGVAGARPEEPPIDPLLLVRALDAAGRLALPPEPLPEVMPRTVTLSERADLIRAALRSAPAIVLQDLLRGVRDRVVIAVTFLAMLELVKRREVGIEQDEPWGPIRCVALRP
jgi:segregation and condensation protein A